MPMTSALRVAEVSATGQAMPVASRGNLNTVNLIAAAAAATAVIYDNASSATGTPIARVSAPAGWSISLVPQNVPFYNGLWVVLTGAGAICEVFYE